MIILSNFVFSFKTHRLYRKKKTYEFNCRRQLLNKRSSIRWRRETEADATTDKTFDIFVTWSVVQWMEIEKKIMKFRSNSPLKFGPCTTFVPPCTTRVHSRPRRLVFFFFIFFFHDRRSATIARARHIGPAYLRSRTRPPPPLVVNLL